MKPWVRELLAVAAVAGTTAFVLPRLVLPSPAGAPTGFTRAAHAETPPSPSPTPVAPPPLPPISWSEPGDDDATAPLNTPEEPRARVVRRARTQPVAALPGGALTRRNGWWVADLRALPPVRTVLAGTQLQPPDERDPTARGYRIVRTDNRGLMAAAGIRAGDVLVGVNGMPLRNPDDVLDAVARLRSATRATFEFERGSARYTVPVEVVGRDPHASVLE